MLADCLLAARSSPDLDLFSVVVAVIGRLMMTNVRSARSSPDLDLFSVVVSAVGCLMETNVRSGTHHCVAGIHCEGLDQGRPGFHMTEEGSSGGSMGRRIRQGAEVKTSSEIGSASCFFDHKFVLKHEIKGKPSKVIILPSILLPAHHIISLLRRDVHTRRNAHTEGYLYNEERKHR
ncbi:hypothetical protein KSP40_PGU011062 [Platanthera guangdongensis]|uniref:Uncharacterized protein n=1 Tax=Platanthera guangdongensis TaxID=2320717 RepID=A0ABR2LMZ9_9ASPA